MEQLHKTKVNDVFVKDGVIRPDGLLEHDMYIVQVKTPAESKGDWDFYKILKTMKGDEAFGKLAELDLPAGQEVAALSACDASAGVTPLAAGEPLGTPISDRLPDSVQRHPVGRFGLGGDLVERRRRARARSAPCRESRACRSRTRRDR